MNNPPNAADTERSAMLEEGQWREQEEKIKEVTYDAQMREEDRSVQAQGTELESLRSFPLASLVAAGVMTPAVEEQLRSQEITTLEQLVEWVRQR